MMSKYFKLTVSSMTMHELYIKAPDNIDEDDIRCNFRKFDGGYFSIDDLGDWEYSDSREVDKEEYDDYSFRCDWEDRYQ